MEKEKKGFFEKINFFQKLKSIKHIEIVVALVLGAVAILIYLSTFSSSSKSETISETSATEYTSMLEQKLENIIKKIDGVESASVAITLASGPEYVYATDDEKKVNTNESNGNLTTSSTSTSSPVIISNDVVIVKEIMPQVSGIVVVAKGASNTKVKLEIIRAIQALVDVPQSSIEVLAGK